MDLLILAGGMGSRFGGSKQTACVDENNNFIMDYSIYDALESGFDRAVLVIKEEQQELFNQTICKRIPKEKLAFVYQSNEVAKKMGIDRIKPLGTAHAVLSAKDVVGNNNFLMINADDFYGRTAFKIAFDYLNKTEKTSFNFGNVCYELKNTLSDFGAVKRGVCEVKNGLIENIKECSVSENKEPITIRTLEGNKPIAYNKNLYANMNMFCLTPAIFPVLENGFAEFAKTRENVESKEYLMPEVLGDLASKKQATLKLLKTKEKWFGVTYREDLPFVKQKIATLKASGTYPQNLWNNQ